MKMPLACRLLFATLLMQPVQEPIVTIVGRLQRITFIIGTVVGLRNMVDRPVSSPKPIKYRKDKRLRHTEST